MVSAAVSKLLPYLLRYRRRFAAGFVFLVFATAIQMVTPWVLKYGIDDLAAGIAAADPAAARRLGLYAGAIVGMACAGGVGRFLMRRVIVGASRDIEYDLRNAFFAHLQRLPRAWFQTHRTGDLMSRATSDLAAVRVMAGPAVMYTATTLIAFIAALVLMLSISPSLTLLALVPLPVVSIVVRHFGDVIYKRSERIQAQRAHLTALVQEALAGVRVVRAYRREQVEINRFRDANREYVARNRAMVRVQGVFHPSLALFLGFSALVVLWFGSRQVIEGRLTVGDLVAFNAYVAMVSWPMIAFGWVTDMLQRGMAAWRRMLDVLEAQPDAADGASGVDTVCVVAASAVSRAVSRPPAVIGPAEIRGEVEFRNLTFAYNGRNVLSDVDARVAPGQMLALVGPTGSGESTLVDLLPRLFEPPRGTVFVDGTDVRDLPLSTLRGAIGYVPQEPFLFSTTVAENVAFGAVGAGAIEAGTPARLLAESPVLPDELRAAVEHAAAIVRLDADIRAFPDGYETTVGERGVMLSGGQKQRVALARALVADPRILILDDALSAVDTHTEEAILARLRGVLRRRTSIVVAHRISTVRDADLILVLDDGRVVERGTHDALVARDGLYAGLYRKQLLARALDRD